MIERYNKYRSYGHGRVISAVNAMPVGAVLALSAGMGLYIGWFVL